MKDCRARLAATPACQPSGHACLASGRSIPSLKVAAPTRIVSRAYFTNWWIAGGYIGAANRPTLIFALSQKSLSRLVFFVTIEHGGKTCCQMISM